MKTSEINDLLEELNFSSDGEDFPFKDRMIRAHDTLRSLTEEIAELRKALEWCSSRVWESGGIDGGDFQDAMEPLLVEVPASKEHREEWDCDTMLVWRWNAERQGG